MSRASGLRAKLGVSVEVFSLPADGDCFYTGVSRALSSVRGGGGGGAEGGAGQSDLAKEGKKAYDHLEDIATYMIDYASIVKEWEAEQLKNKEMVDGEGLRAY